MEGQANIALELQGSGYHPDQISATLKCDKLHIKINDRDLHNIKDIWFHFTNRQLILAPAQIGEENITWLNGRGTIDLDGNMNLHLGIDRLPYGVLVPAITLTLLEQSFLKFDGFLTSQIRVLGNFNKSNHNRGMGVRWARWKC